MSLRCQKVKCEFGKIHEVYGLSEVFEPYKCTMREQHGGNNNDNRIKKTEKK